MFGERGELVAAKIVYDNYQSARLNNSVQLSQARPNVVIRREEIRPCSVGSSECIVRERQFGDVSADPPDRTVAAY